MENAIIERAKAHFAAMAPKPRKIKIPEWDLDIFVKPLNLVEKQAVFALVNSGKHLQGMAEAILLTAKDSSGAQVFSIKDRSALLRDVDPDVVARVGAEIINPEASEIELGESSPEAAPPAV